MHHADSGRVPAKWAILAGAAMAAAVAVTAACGGSSSARSAASPTAARAASGTPAHGGFGDRTPRPEIQTSIAEGTPFGESGDGAPSPDMQTAIAQGTPAHGAGERGGPGGGRRTLSDVAAILAIDGTELQTELEAPGATIASVAALYGMDRPTIRQALIDAEAQRLADSVANGELAQAAADDQTSQFEARVDQLLDGNGNGTGVPPPPPQ